MLGYMVKRFWIPLTLVLIHAVAVAMLSIHIALSSPVEVMAWIIFVYIDFPMSLCFNLLPSIIKSSNILISLTFLVAGTIQWGIVGFALQYVVRFLQYIVSLLRN
jgi:hypothetical protein